jgi:hypothetical protein
MTKSGHIKKTEADPLLFYGRRINNSSDLINAQLAVMTDVITGKISPAESRRLYRQSSAILKAAELLCRTASRGAA